MKQNYKVQLDFNELVEQKGKILALELKLEARTSNHLLTVYYTWYLKGLRL